MSALTAMNTLIAQLQRRGDRNGDELAQELTALESIYGNELQFVAGTTASATSADVELRLQLTTVLPDSDISLRLLIILPNGYPDIPPHLELVNRSLGTIGVDDAASQFVSCLYSTNSDVPWVKGEPVLFEGISAACDYLRSWYDEKSQFASTQSATACAADTPKVPSTSPNALPSLTEQHSVDLRSLVHSDPIIERKSEFIGHAARLRHPDDVRFASRKPTNIRYRCFSHIS